MAEKISQNYECYVGTKQKDSKDVVFGLSTRDRRRHMYVVGKTGTGKTTLLTNMILQDIYNGLGVCFIDPHGDPSEYIIDRIPLNRHKDVVYFNPADTEYPIGLNILQPQRGEEPFLIVSSLLAVFNKIWAGAWSSRMEYILANTLLAILEKDQSNLLDVIKLLTDDKYRKKLVSKLNDPIVKNFWVNEYGNFNNKYRQEAISPILNKIGQFFSNKLVRNIVAQKNSTIDIREIMDSGKILIVNLSKGRLGEENANLLGSLLVSKIQLAAMSRVDISEDQRKDFFVYVDEFQNFTTESFASILSEARKYRLNLILAHQYISQLLEGGTSKIKNAIFGNVGMMVSFRVGAMDANEINREFANHISIPTLLNLDKAEIAAKIDIENRNTDPFLAKTLPPLFEDLKGCSASVIQSSRKLYGRNVLEIQKEIDSYFNSPSPQNHNPKSEK